MPPFPSAPRPLKDPSEAENYDPTLPASQRDYRLTKTDFYLKKALPQRIPPQHFYHSTSDVLLINEREQRATAQVDSHKKLIGVVVDTGKMHKTVKVRIPGQRWNLKIKKYFASHTQHLVHDPNSSLVPGDVVELHRLRVSSAVRHVVADIISPFGQNAEDRPPIPSADERLAAYKEKRFAKLHRRTLRRQAAEGNAEAIRELRRMGLDPGRGVEAGKGETANTQKGVGKTRNPKGAILGEKGQKLPHGVLPGGKHEVGKINDRAQHNKSKAMRRQAHAEANLLEAKEKGERLEKEKDLGADS